MKLPRRLAALVLGACLTVFSGCAHLLTDPGFPGVAHDAHARSHLERIEREKSAYESVIRETSR